MTISSDALRRLAALRLAPEAMAEVLSIIADVQAVEEATQAGISARRSKDLARKFRGNSVEIPRKDAEAPPPSRARVVNTSLVKEDKEDISPPSEARHPDEVSNAFDGYNAKASVHGWPQCEKRTDQRKSSMLARLRDGGGLAGWMAALDRGGKSSFLTGASPSGWLPNIDFFLQRKSFIKLIEGGYDDNPTRRLPQQPPARRSGADALMAALAAELGGPDDRGLAHGGTAGADFADGPILDLEPTGPTRSVAERRQ